MTNLSQLPPNLPKPTNDGLADHLVGMIFPNILLSSTNRDTINTQALQIGITVLYCYPMTGQPNIDLPKGWNEIPGARGCTPQALSYAEKFEEFKKRNVELFGLSTQTTEYQKEMSDRLNLSFSVLSDNDLELTKLLNLPTFEVEGKTLLKRLTMVIKDGIIIKVFYPVFPPDLNAEEVLQWLDDTLFVA